MFCQLKIMHRRKNDNRRMHGRKEFIGCYEHCTKQNWRCIRYKKTGGAFCSTRFLNRGKNMQISKLCVFDRMIDRISMTFEIVSLRVGEIL